MPVFNMEEARGVQRDHEIFCLQCVDGENFKFQKGDEIIEQNDLERDDTKLYVCDECGEEL